MPDIPEVPLREVTEQVTTKIATGKDPEKPYVGLEHLEPGSPHLTGTAPSSASVSTNTVFQAGDTLFGKLRPYLRKSVIAPFGGYCSTDILVLRAIEGAHPRFVGHLLRSEDVFAAAVRSSIGTRMPRTSWRALRNVEVYAPPREEQRQIAQILDTLDEAIRKTEAIIAKLKQVKQGLLHDLLTRGIDDNGELRDPERHSEQFKASPLGRIPREWVIAPIDDFLDRVIDYRGRTPTKTSSGTPLITAKNVREGYLDPEPREFIAEGTFDSWMTRGVPNAGDVLFTTEAPLGNVAPLPSGRLALAQRIITLVANRAMLDPGYLLHLLLLPQSQRRIVARSTGTTVLGIKQSVFRRVPFWFAPLVEQKAVAKQLRACAHRVTGEQRELSKLRLLKRGLMEDLLSGRVRVTNLLEEAAE